MDSITKIKQGSFAACVFFGCGTKSPLEGKWTSTFTVRNGLERPEKAGEIVLYLNFERKTEYAFNSGSFSKKTSQRLSSVEKVGDYELPKTEEELAKELDSEIETRGSYNVFGGNVNFFTETVVLPDGSELDVADSPDISSLIGESEYHEEFRLSEDSLFLGGVEFKKAQ